MTIKNIRGRGVVFFNLVDPAPRNLCMAPIPLETAFKNITGCVPELPRLSHMAGVVGMECEAHASDGPAFP